MGQPPQKVGSQSHPRKLRNPRKESRGFEGKGLKPLLRRKALRRKGFQPHSQPREVWCTKHSKLGGKQKKGERFFLKLGKLKKKERNKFP